MPLPRYLLADWDPAGGRSMEAWARELAAQGWRQWAGPGCWTSIDGRRVWRVSLRLEQPSPAAALPPVPAARDLARGATE